MLNNIKSYMRKSFATFSNPEYQASDKLKSSASKWILENVVKKNKDIRESALKELKTKNMTENQTKMNGIASDHLISVRGLAYIIAGHEKHHFGILNERYLA